MNILQIEEIIKVFHRKLTATPTEFHRYLYDKIDWRDSLIGIKGPKGCGKTTLMLQHIKESFTGDALKSVLYVSLDNLWFASNNLTDLISSFITTEASTCSLMKYIMNLDGRDCLKTSQITTLR